MLEVTEENKTHISKAEKPIQDISVDVESPMQDFEESISLLALDWGNLSKKRSVRKVAQDIDSDSESDFEEDAEPVRACSDSESDFEEDEEPVNDQKARTSLQNKSTNKKKQTAEQRIIDSFGHDSLPLHRNRVAGPKREERG
jgi:hypothetical protein